MLAHLNHRLAQICLRLLRAEVWSQGSHKKLHRVTARLVPDNALTTPVVIAHGRLVVFGGDNQRLHEEVIMAGGIIREGRFARMNVGETKAAYDAALADPAPAGVCKRLQDLWPSISNALLQSLEARMTDRTKGLQKTLDERCEQEVANITTVLRELEKTIRRNSMSQPVRWNSGQRRNASSLN